MDASFQHLVELQKEGLTRSIGVWTNGGANSYAVAEHAIAMNT